MSVKYWQWLLYSLCIVTVLFLCVFFFIQKKNNGYYLYSGNFGGFNREIPVYRIMNNWSYWPDAEVYKTSDREEIIIVFKELTKK